MDSEVDVEEYLIKRVREHGGLCEKVLPVRAGVPDRMVLLDGQVHLVELKTKGGRLRSVQMAFHVKAARAGVHVYVINSKEEVDQWISETQ